MVSNHFAHSEFPHRMNKNGVIDSICRRCFATIGSSTWEADLERIEAAHVCEPTRLASFKEHRRIAVVSDRPLDSHDVSERKPVASHSRRAAGTLTARRPA